MDLVMVAWYVRQQLFLHFYIAFSLISVAHFILFEQKDRLSLLLGIFTKVTSVLLLLVLIRGRG